MEKCRLSHAENVVREMDWDVDSAEREHILEARRVMGAREAMVMDGSSQSYREKHRATTGSADLHILPVSVYIIGELPRISRSNSNTR